MNPIFPEAFNMKAPRGFKVSPGSLIYLLI